MDYLDDLLTLQDLAYQEDACLTVYKLLVLFQVCGSRVVPNLQVKDQSESC